MTLARKIAFGGNFSRCLHRSDDVLKSSMMKIDFKKYEIEMVACIERAVSQVMVEYSDEHFYAAALHEFYRESGDRISLPGLAVNTSEEVNDAGDNLWSSPDWYWTDLEFASKKLFKLHDNLESEASRLTTAHWDKIHTQWMSTLVRVAKQLTKRLKNNNAATKDFGFYLFDWEGDEVALLRQCMSAAKFKRLFPALQKTIDKEKADAQRPAEQKLAMYKNDLYMNGDKIIQHGKAAIPMLIDCLNSEQGWRAAGLLAELGISNNNVIQALRRRASSSEKGSPRFHFTTALAVLGDIDFVLDLAKKARTREAAIDGIKSLYGSGNNGFIPVSLDYTPLERLLSIKSCSKLAQRPCKPSHYALASRGSIRPDDTDTAIAGTNSKYKMIREHAVCALGDRSLGKAVSERAMQAIVDRFNDRAMTVRYLAVINIGYWKKAAKEHVPAIRRLMRNDPDPDVRYMARRTIQDLGFKP